MLYQETSRIVGERADDLIFVVREAEAADIILDPGARIDHEDLRRRLFDDRAGNLALQRILCALRGKADNAVALSDRLFPILDPPHEHFVVERFPAFVDHNDRRRPVEPFLDAVKQVHHGGGADRGIVEDRSHVEADGIRGEIGQISLVVEQPGTFALAPPRTQARPQIGGMRAVATAKQLDQMPQPTVLEILREIGVDRVLDPLDIFEVGPACQLRDPVAQKLPIGGSVGDLQRIEARRRAGPQNVVAPADRADEQLGTAILVEEHDARPELPCLRE